MNLVDGVFDRAFAFREATARLREDRVLRDWPAAAWHGRAWPMVEHGERELDWERVDIPALVASLPLDHTVCAVADTEGGSVAADRRWREFRDARLANYARDRDDATIPGVSRMSAYLHHGMISPMRLAREAARLGGEGAEKYLDEMLVWRELSYHWCRHMPEHTGIAALPAWARRTLERHRPDERATLSGERLARGRTGDELWDLAQRSLLAHGELHNNLRMTWGKAIPAWCATPESALTTLIELNNRYALDGGDPASYGGLLWCLGLFDRAFAPEVPVLGSVRPRTTEGHRARLDVARYREIALRRAHPLRVAVIGAGVSGLACARSLSDHCIDAVVFEKSRGSGGRIATRRGDAGSFDHGAQYCSARTPAFARMLAHWEKEGVVSPWRGRFVEVGSHGVVPIQTSGRWVGVPSMSSLCAHLAHGLEIRTRTRVAQIAPDGTRWRMHGVDDEGNQLDLGVFDAVLCSAPAPQTAQLLGAVAPAIASVASRSAMRATWSLMWSSQRRLELPFDHAEVLPGFAEVGESLAWVSRISAKPGRASDGIDRWTVLARPEWSEERLERDASEMSGILSQEFEKLARQLGVAWSAPIHAVAHRWRYALASGDGGPSSIYDAGLGVGACGDWLHGTRVEDAYLSGIALAARVVGTGSQRSRAIAGARQAAAARM
jgi:predicted NAD/FAD-dependent oxidoreductase